MPARNGKTGCRSTPTRPLATGLGVDPASRTWPAFFPARTMHAPSASRSLIRTCYPILVGRARRGVRDGSISPASPRPDCNLMPRSGQFLHRPTAFAKGPRKTLSPFQDYERSSSERWPALMAGVESPLASRLPVQGREIGSPGLAQRSYHLMDNMNHGTAPQLKPENDMSFVTSSWMSPSATESRLAADAERFALGRFSVAADEVAVYE